MLAEPPNLDAPYPDIAAVVRQYAQPMPKTALGKDGAWHLASAAAADRLKKMRDAGPTLGEYVQGQIYYGVKTGLNEAFIIDGPKRAELIAADPASAELIKPLVRGRDIKRWRVNQRDEWLIVTKIGVEIKRYPAVFRHLKQFQAPLEKRQDQGNHWWELRACAYYDAFEKPKIVFPDIAPDVRFGYAAEPLFIPNTAYLIRSDDIYLLALLNSKPVGDLYAQLSAQIRGGYVRFFTQYVSQIPIPAAPAAERAAIAALAGKCLDAKGEACGVWEAEIDARVAALYGV